MTAWATPSLNAALNGVSAAALLAGYAFIRARRVLAHKISMGLATLSSAFFLASYLHYHAQSGATRFQGTGWIRPVYFTVLLTHTVLAAAVFPMVLVTLFWALRGRFDRHARWARWTWPVWIYVSATGVAIYWMLYHL